MEINEEQRQAIEISSGPVLVLAGPGTGKTAVIAEHIRFLKESGVPAETILVITFTRAAAAEMEKRSKREEGETSPLFGTFHSVFYRFLREAHVCRPGSICTEAEKRIWLRDILEERERRAGRPELAGEMQEIQSQLLDGFSVVKSSGIHPEEYACGGCSPALFAALFAGYEEERKKNGKLDFDDILLEFVKVMRQNVVFRERLQERYHHLIIDEFQDVNRIQYEAVNLISGAHDNLFCVGDDDQSIYGFRGADPGIMLQFPKDHPGTRLVTLKSHYRCRPDILQAAAALIRKNQNRYEKKLFSVRESGGTITCSLFEDSKEEATQIAKKLCEYHESGIAWENLAVLYRAETILPPLVRAFQAYRIPFLNRETKGSFFDRMFVREIASYFRLSAGLCRREDFLRVMNYPERYISRQAVMACWTEEGLADVFGRLRNYYEKKPVMKNRIIKWESDLQRMSHLPPSAALVYLRLAVGFERAAVQAAAKEGGDKEAVLEALEECRKRAEEYRSPEEWVAAIEEEKSPRKQRAPGEKGVSLLTMHASKGLEFPVVFLPSCNETVIPNGKAEESALLEEERRLFYVAITRARDALHVSCVKKRKDNYPPPSRFLAEAGLLAR